MERIGLDVYHVGSRKFLAMVDFYSSFILVKEMKRTTNENIFKCLDAWFSMFSSPQFCRCDGGEFRDAFDRFLGQRGIIREQGSAYQSQSQGLIERNLGTLKALQKKKMREGKPWALAAGELNRAPRASRPSPAEMFFGRYCRSTVLPELPRVVTKDDVVAGEESRDKLRLDTAVAAVKRQERAPLVVGQEVLMQDATTKLWSRHGTVKAVRPSGRSYIIDSGERLYKRNIKWLRPAPVEAVTFVSDAVKCDDTGGLSALGAGDTAVESAAGLDDDGGASGGFHRSPGKPARAGAAPQARRARRSCLARASERRCFLGGEESPRKQVTWGNPLYTSVTVCDLQSRHELQGGRKLLDAACV